MKLTCIFIFCVGISTAVKDDFYFRIVGGRFADPGEFPYQVAINQFADTNSHVCSGTIISFRFVLTAAHCLEYETKDTICITAGHINGLLNKPSVVRNVSRLIIHEDYNNTRLFNDIALIELEEDLPSGNHLISSIPLNTNILDSGTCTVTGWGLLKEDADQFSDALMAAQVYVVDFDKCKSMYDKIRSSLTTGMICAGHPQGLTSVCGGDSGGPLVFNGSVVGITSWGVGCGSVNFPNVYTNVASYVTWIESKISMKLG